MYRSELQETQFVASLIAVDDEQGEMEIIQLVEVYVYMRILGPDTQDAVLETSHAMPKTPVMFFKPSTAVHGHGADVIIPRVGRNLPAD